jgi:hypothetical protein
MSGVLILAIQDYLRANSKVVSIWAHREVRHWQQCRGMHCNRYDALLAVQQLRSKLATAAVQHRKTRRLEKQALPFKQEGLLRIAAQHGILSYVPVMPTLL